MVYIIVNIFEYRIQIIEPSSSTYSRSKSHIVIHLFMLMNIYLCSVYPTNAFLIILLRP